MRTQKNYKKLGFTYLETAEIVVAINKLMANYIVHYHKLRNFHWNVEGADFFELHQQFEVEYDKVKENIDILAERIRVFGIKPRYTLKQFMALAEVGEVDGELSSLQMVKEVLKDFGIIHDSLLNVANFALEAGDMATEEIMMDMIRDLEKRNWMFTSFVK
ncbi:Dps family protein [Sungkyunkwania multivorans]|uniref:Dps family protein n=1 Tax=Sungkyunkwania multivorans TaxID=1173618 RepID=A0ABW3CY61_9FLAO